MEEDREMTVEEDVVARPSTAAKAPGVNLDILVKRMEYLERKTKLMTVMSQHIGKQNAIGMGELYKELFNEDWEHRINDTRPLRTLITEVKEEGFSILSSSSKEGGGYWLANSASEIEEFWQKRRQAALKILAMESRVRKMAMPELLGQIAMNLA